MSGSDPRAASPLVEILATIGFIAVLAVCVHFGGPAHLASTGIICLIYFLFGLSVVRKGLLIVGILAFPFSLFGDPHSGDEGNIHVAQFALWLGTAVLWIPSLLLGYLVRRRIDQRNRTYRESDPRPPVHPPSATSTPQKNQGSLRNTQHFPPPPAAKKDSDS